MFTPEAVIFRVLNPDHKEVFSGHYHECRDFIKENQSKMPGIFLAFPEDFFAEKSE